MRKLTTVFATVVVVLGLIWLGLIGIAYAGIVDVAATGRSLSGVDWFFSTLAAHSIDEHAEKAVASGAITPPSDVTDERLREGSAEYAEMCVTCHGGPGVEAGEIGKGLYPAPPDLAESARDMDPAEIYWVLSNGIRHTGMPAFGPTHRPDELWDTAFFVDRLDTMTAADYQRLLPDDEELGQGPEHGDVHEHGDLHEHGDVHEHGDAHEHGDVHEDGGTRPIE